MPTPVLQDRDDGCRLGKETPSDKGGPQGTYLGEIPGMARSAPKCNYRDELNHLSCTNHYYTNIDSAEGAVAIGKASKRSTTCNG